MKKRWDLLLAIAVIVVLAAALVRVENQRYAMQVGMCKDNPTFPLGWDYKCLATVETRTSWLWHLYYALTGNW